MEEKRPSNLPYGYVKTPDGEIAKEPGEQEILAEIERHTKAGLSSSKIAALLNDDGHRTRHGTEWKSTNIRYLWKTRGRMVESEA